MKNNLKLNFPIHHILNLGHNLEILIRPVWRGGPILFTKLSIYLFLDGVNNGLKKEVDNFDEADQGEAHAEAHHAA